MIAEAGSQVGFQPVNYTHLRAFQDLDYRGDMILKEPRHGDFNVAYGLSLAEAWKLVLQ